VIVAMFQFGKADVKSIIAWVYTARKKDLSAWPRNTTHLINDHFQLIDRGCFIGSANTLRAHSSLYGINYDQGVNIVTRKIDTFEGSGNSIINVRISCKMPFPGLPAELKHMVFKHMLALEKDKDE
jgi:hypothetical protein